MCWAECETWIAQENRVHSIVKSHNVIVLAVLDIYLSRLTADGNLKPPRTAHVVGPIFSNCSIL